MRKKRSCPRKPQFRVPLWGSPPLLALPVPRRAAFTPHQAVLGRQRGARTAPRLGRGLPGVPGLRAPRHLPHARAGASKPRVPPTRLTRGPALRAR